MRCVILHQSPWQQTHQPHQPSGVHQPSSVSGQSCTASTGGAGKGRLSAAWVPAGWESPSVQPNQPGGALGPTVLSPGRAATWAGAWEAPASKCLTQCHALVLSLWVLTACTSESSSWPSLLLPVHEQLRTTSHHAGPGQDYSVRQDHIALPYCCWAQALPSFLTIWQVNLKSWLDCKPMARFPLDTKWICCHYWLQNH